MKALLSTASGGPSTLIVGNLPDPVPGRGQVVIDVKACAVNFPDSLIIEDRYQFRPARPFSPGAEVAGVVSLVGEGVSSWKPGDRVIGVSLAGGMAEKMLIGEGDLVVILVAVAELVGSHRGIGKPRLDIHYGLSICRRRFR